MTEPNVLQFPKDKIFREAVQDIDAVKKTKEKGLINFADSIVEDLTSSIISDVGNYGIDMENPNFLNDLRFMVAILAATIYRNLELEHPLHEFMDKNIIFLPEEEMNEGEVSEEDISLDTKD